MSIEVDVIPTVCFHFTWGQLKQHLCQSTIKPQSKALLGSNPQLCELEKHKAVNEDELLTPPHHYYFDLPLKNTLNLVVERNEDVGTNEMEVLDEVGRNLSVEERQQLAAKWHKCSYCYVIGSFGGRNIDEPSLFVEIVASIADLCSGSILVKESGVFDLGIGVYFPNHFREAKPRFFLRST